MTVPVQTIEALDIRVGTIVEAQTFPRARKPAPRLDIGFGFGPFGYAGRTTTFVLTGVLE